MSYIIVAEFFTDTTENTANGVQVLLSDPKIRLLSKDEENQSVKLDMRGDFEIRQEQVRWFCNKLIDAGILSFKIHHSY